MLDDIFGEGSTVIQDVYVQAQKVIKRYMDIKNKKIEYVAQELGTTAGYFRKQLDPNQSDRPLSIDRIIAITKLTMDKRILEVIARQFELILVNKNKGGVSCGDVNVLVDLANIENSDVFKTVKIALADGEISKDEKVDILNELDEADKANAELREKVKNM
jgi:hypothetical protein